MCSPENPVLDQVLFIDPLMPIRKSRQNLSIQQNPSCKCVFLATMNQSRELLAQTRTKQTIPVAHEDLIMMRQKPRDTKKPYHSRCRGTHFEQANWYWNLCHARSSVTLNAVKRAKRSIVYRRRILDVDVLVHLPRVW